ncbi:Phage virion morphogenesis family protein [compost metagenome]
MVRLGTNVVYAAIHQLGGEVKIPPRTQVIAFDERGKMMSRKEGRREGVRTRTNIRFANMKARTIKIPARPFLGVTGKDRRHILEELKDYLSD